MRKIKATLVFDVPDDVSDETIINILKAIDTRDVDLTVSVQDVTPLEDTDRLED